MYKLLYKVIWLEYKNTEEESNWLSISKLAHISNIISNFHQAYPDKPSLLPSPQLLMSFYYLLFLFLLPLSHLFSFQTQSIYSSFSLFSSFSFHCSNYGTHYFICNQSFEGLALKREYCCIPSNIHTSFSADHTLFQLSINLRTKLFISHQSYRILNNNLCDI